MGVKIQDICEAVTAEDCVFQAPVRTRRKLIRPAACLPEPDFPTVCSDAKAYSSLMPGGFKDTCQAIDGCLYTVLKRKNNRVVRASCTDAPPPPNTCADAKAWGQDNGQTLADACAFAVEDCDYYAPVRRRRNGRMRVVKAARCDVPATLAPTQPITGAPTSAPTEAPTTDSPTSSPTEAPPCNPTSRCSGKYVCVKLNNANNNACSTTVDGCGNQGVLYTNSFC